jgi:hypothetical protein
MYRFLTNLGISNALSAVVTRYSQPDGEVATIVTWIEHTKSGSGSGFSGGQPKINPIELRGNSIAIKEL